MWGAGSWPAWFLAASWNRPCLSAAREAVGRTAEEICPGDQQKAGDVALAIREVFGVQVPVGSLTRGQTTLELLRAGTARQLAVLDDPVLTGTGQSYADVLGVRAGVLAEKLADYLVSAIIAEGSRGGPLYPLANQLNHDRTHLSLDLLQDRAGLGGDGDVVGFEQIDAGTRASRSADGEPPLFITATLGSTLYRSHDWVVDVPVAELARWNSSVPPVGKGGMGMWAFRNHLQSADSNCLELTVEGRTSQAVVLTQMRFHVLSRRPGSVPRGVRLDLSCLSLGASIDVRNFEVDLGIADVAVPTPQPLDPHESRLTPDFPYVVSPVRTPDFPYVVNRTDPECFYFSLDYGDEDIEWVAVLDWLSAGRSGSVRVDDAGAPFTSTAFRSRPVYIWNASGKARHDHLCANEGCYRNHHRSRK